MKDTTNKETHNSLEQSFTISAKTSIYRSGPSLPVKSLLEKDLFTKGTALNFGCGKHTHDTEAIGEITGDCVGYDYTYLPNHDAITQTYDNVYCGYVVNTLTPKPRDFVWNQLAFCTAGVAFVSARTDKVQGTSSHDGVITLRGTFQKKYRPNELKEEAQKYFSFVYNLKVKQGFALVACSHEPIPQYIAEYQHDQT